MDRFGTSFVKKPPWLLLLNLGVKFSIYSISNPVMWICVLILGKIFANSPEHNLNGHGAIVSEVVTSMGLMQSINIIGVVFFIAIGAGSNTYIARIFGRYKSSKKKYSLLQLADDYELKYFHGTTIFCFFLLCVVLIPIILFVGPYVARTQNFYLPSNYLKDIQILLVFYTLSLPFFGFVTINAYHLNSEGNSGWCSIIGILNILFFVSFAFLFNNYQKSGGFGHYLDPVTQQNEIIVFNIGCAILFSGIAMFLFQMLILYWLHLHEKSVIFRNLSSIFWVKWSVFCKIIKISLPIYVRVMVSFLAIIMLNVAVEFLRFPNGESDFKLIGSGTGTKEPSQKQLYATYWEYILFSINSIFIIIYRIVASFSNTSIRAAVGFYYGQQNFKKVYASIKAALIYCILIIIIYEITFTANAKTILTSLFGLHNGGIYEVVYNNRILHYQANHILSQAEMIFWIWNATIFVIAIQYMCPGISLTLGKLRITYFMFIIDKIIFTIPFMIILLLFSFLLPSTNNKNYVLFFCSSTFADLATLLVSIYVFKRLIKSIKKLEENIKKKKNQSSDQVAIAKKNQAVVMNTS